MIGRLRLEGATLRGIAARLNALGVKTPQGGQWHPSTVGTALRVTEEVHSILSDRSPVRRHLAEMIVSEPNSLEEACLAIEENS